MKASVFTLIFCAAFLLSGAVKVYCADSASSDVIIIGATDKSSTESQAAEVESSGDQGLSKEDGQEPPTAPDFYEISGSKIGATQVSQPLSLPSEGEIMFVEAGISRAFAIVRVGEGGNETLFLNAEPERAVGARLPKGVYKVYPQDPDGAFALDKLTAKVQIRLLENKTGETQ